MNDTAIKSLAINARLQLLDEVGAQMRRWAIDDAADTPDDVEVLAGQPLTAQQRDQRRQLLERCRQLGAEQLREQAAYTWFNRFAAIRFMELHDYLPCHMRFFSAIDGSFAPQVLDEALRVDIQGVDSMQVAQLVTAGDREALFRYLLLAQCNELAAALPAVFERVGAGMELLLPAHLLRVGSVVEQLVTAVPEDDWREGVEIVGWMYQYYVSERKDEVFASFKKGKKAERDAIAPATQLFTPNWIVRYLTENSLGRLWMLNKPDSALPESMPYFVKPDEDAETEFKKISSPEEITVVDPACGSGHILVYAFDLLSRMYAEAGYSSRDAARLIVEKNLFGFEIDPRAAAMASFAVTMKARELDSRFFRRGVVPKITVLNRVEFVPEEKELLGSVAANIKLLDAATHLDECGSLFKPSQEDLDDIARDLTSLAEGESLFAASARDKLERLQAELLPLSERYDVVVANPPYMGSSSLSKWNGKWIKDNFPEAYRDLCTGFIDRGFTLSNDQGYSAMVTMQSWMFLGSYEKLRGKLLRNHTISSMAHLGTRAFGAIGGEVVSTTATVFANKKYDVPGTYLRLVDMQSEEAKREGALEALANPECGWFYRTDASGFEAIPGSPIAYWASEASLSLFGGNAIGDCALLRTGMKTGDNERFLRMWWEPSYANEYVDCHNDDEAIESGLKWFPYNKGGEYRKWYGNNEWVVNFQNDGAELIGDAAKDGRHIQNLDKKLRFKASITWSLISSGSVAFRYKPAGHLYDMAGMSMFAEDNKIMLALCNSSVALRYLSYLAPTLNFQVGDVARIPFVEQGVKSNAVQVLSVVRLLIEGSKCDYDSFETSWDFKRHPLL